MQRVMNSGETEPEERGAEALLARATVLAAWIRNWAEVLGRELADQAPPVDEERIEYLAGYIDPHSSWEVILVESVRSFPGAAARFGEILDELTVLLEETKERELFRTLAGVALGAVHESLESMRGEAARITDAVTREKFGELDRSIQRLALLFGTFGVCAPKPQSARSAAAQTPELPGFPLH
jgi:hypothetical protein